MQLEGLKRLLSKIFKGKEEAKKKGEASYIKVIAVGRFQDESEGKIIQGGWIKSPPAGQPIYDNARGDFLFPLNLETLEPAILPSLPDKDTAKIEYHPNRCHPLWAVAKSLLFLEDGRIYVWPEVFSLYQEDLPRLMKEREAAFSSLK